MAQEGRQEKSMGVAGIIAGALFVTGCLAYALWQGGVLPFPGGRNGTHYEPYQGELTSLTISLQGGMSGTQNTWEIAVGDAGEVAASVSLRPTSSDREKVVTGKVDPQIMVSIEEAFVAANLSAYVDAPPSEFIALDGNDTVVWFTYQGAEGKLSSAQEISQEAWQAVWSLMSLIEDALGV